MQFPYQIAWSNGRAELEKVAKIWMDSVLKMCALFLLLHNHVCGIV